MPSLATVDEHRRIQFSPHPGQWRAWNSESRFTLILAGTQSGKTSFGPHWLYREIKRRGPGDYLVVTPTFQLLEKKALPEFRKLFERWLNLGRYTASPSRKFVFSQTGDQITFGKHDPDEPTTVWFGYADDPESLESATVKAAWLDEAGQKRFRLGSWEAILRRLAIHQGRSLITTTPYDLGWLKQQVYDKWQDGHPDYNVVRFDSTENPVFPKEEFERARDTMPLWRFNMFYRGIFTRPAGLIYDNFINEYRPHGHRVKAFHIPAHWPRFLGLDFGGVHTGGTFLAEEPATGKLFLYREYLSGKKRASDHVKALTAGEAPIEVAVGGSHSEDQWRLEFSSGGLGDDGWEFAGLPVCEPPIKDVEVGIDRVYAAFQEQQIFVFDTCERFLDEVTSYSREINEIGEPLEAIADKKSYHLLDSLRYIVAFLRNGGTNNFATGGERSNLVPEQRYALPPAIHQLPGVMALLQGFKEPPRRM